MNRLRILIPAILLVVAMVASSQPADAKSGVRLAATIYGAGAATMDAGGLIRGLTTYTIDARLFSDGTATGFFDCVDLEGAVLPNGKSAAGDVFGPITGWQKVNGKITLIGTLQLSGDPTNTPYPYTLAIQKFGGPGKGHWTLDVPLFQAPGDPPICSESLTSGRLVIRQADWQD